MYEANNAKTYECKFGITLPVPTDMETIKYYITHDIRGANKYC